LISSLLVAAVVEPGMQGLAAAVAQRSLERQLR
jgi:hypothetical protein